jgi:uncharacterized protein YbaA (DUF1428 family)
MSYGASRRLFSRPRRIVYKSRAHRDKVNAKVMADPRLADMMDPKDPVFDESRMFWGGFEVIVDV